MLSTGTPLRVAATRLAAQLSRSYAAVAETQQATPPAPPSPPKRNVNKMGGWQLHSYGDIDELQYSDKLKLPQIRSSDECLVRVRTTAVNPIDLAMLRGYGATLLNTVRCKSGDAIEFPLTLGREFCGELVQKGMGVAGNEQLQLGSRVWGVVPISNTAGAHAQYVVVPQSCLAPAPKELDDNEAASVLYAGLTAWSGLYISGFLGGPCGATTAAGGGANKRVLVLGGSGGVGSLAVQMLHAQGVQVLATCSENAVEMVRCLGADIVVDYTNPAQMEQLSTYAPYDIVLDCAGQGGQQAAELKFDFRQYITFSSPMLANIDKQGICLGALQNISDLLQTNVRAATQRGGLVKWGYFYPAAHGIEFLQRLVERRKLMPQIDSSFDFAELPKAFERMKQGHLRGKVVVQLKD
ncbi:reticulon-4-interacting protein 1 homolog, mitochondrial [Drosophila sulfurigaster albostrigata]|uniref:reticulon-4-interacting protein 1 homolog, mitochondrial n=1 Tax=Drosophila sulfurigaster albostrigata TaxID=89887 RepID=UPI002D2185FC|nr:reticulon-4-interacting protein 1 homolog, mitochondrial [Drosophila sulfurigaster albostrigata]